MPTFLPDVLAARLQEKRLILAGCSRCHSVFLSRKQEDDTYAKTCDKCRKYAKRMRERNKLTAEQRAAIAAEKRAARLARDPLLKYMRENFVEYVPERPSRVKHRHSLQAAKTLVSQVKKDRRLNSRRNPWGEK